MAKYSKVSQIPMLQQARERLKNINSLTRNVRDGLIEVRDRLHRTNSEEKRVPSTVDDALGAEDSFRERGSGQ